MKAENRLERSVKAPRKILITGGSGFFARTVIPFLLKTYNAKASQTKIRLFSRNEWRLVETLRENNNNPNLKMWVGDVRDRERVYEAVKDCDLVIHAAALKRVEVCNNVPIEAIKTNVAGSLNVIEACLNCDTRLIFISSDKAVQPLNLYGKTKSIIESVVKTYIDKKFQITRWGNCISSTGAVMPYFVRLAKENKPLTITDSLMTRFLVSKQNIIDTLKTAIDGDNFLILPKKLESIEILRAAQIIKEQLKSKSEIRFIPVTRAEKIHEELEIGVSSRDYLMSDERFVELLKEEGFL